MILLDSVDFLMDNENEKITEDKHIMFWQFISELYQAAHASQVVGFLGMSNLSLAKQLAKLNGYTKIVPATASIAPSNANADVPEDCFLQDSVLDEGQRFKVFWRKNLGWGKESIEKFLKFHYKMLPMWKLEKIAERNSQYGNIRSALAEAADEFPALAESTTSESLVV
jgi:hypothetical protein